MRFLTETDGGKEKAFELFKNFFLKTQLKVSLLIILINSKSVYV